MASEPQLKNSDLTPGEVCLMKIEKQLASMTYPARCGTLEARLTIVLDDVVSAKEFIEQGAVSLAHEKLERILRRFA